MVGGCCRVTRLRCGRASGRARGAVLDPGRCEQPSRALRSVTEPVVVVPYDPLWPQLYEVERLSLKGAFERVRATIEHVGSTAVPGLAAKPIIDIMVGLPSLEEAERHIAALEAIGYHYVPEYEHDLPDRRYFRRPREYPRTHHLHCVREGGEFWNRHLAFRDRLRSDAEAAEAYGALKLELADVYRTDRLGYTEAKSPFIEGILSDSGEGRCT